MALPSSGALSLGDVNVELDSARATQIGLGQASVRTLYGIGSGPIRLAADGYGKANRFRFNQTISSNTNDYNLKNAAIAAGWDQVLVIEATVTINSGVFVGSSSTSSAAFQTGSGFPAGSTLAVINNGFIVGRGGAGARLESGIGGSGGGGGAGVTNGPGGLRGNVPGSIGSNGSPGTNTAGGAGGADAGTAVGPAINFRHNGVAGNAGGLAFLASAPVSVTNNGTIGGGGGGGGQGGSSGDFVGTFSVINAGAGGAGGGLGAAGSAGSGTPAGGNSGGAGGAAGAAVNGNSNITWLATGTRLGAIS